VVIAQYEPRGTTPILGRPELRADLLVRRSLIERLAAAEAPVIVVAGPAGYGKTTLLLQYAERDRRPAGWLSANEADNDPDTFIARLLDILDFFEPLDPDLAGAYSGEPHSSMIASLVGRMLANRIEPFLFLVDDAHLITSAQSLDALAAISMSIPRGSTLILGSRTTPDIRIGRLRALRRVAEIGAPELALSADEGAALVRAVGVDLGKESAEHLTTNAEGWATGLYLAAESMRAGHVSATAFSGDDPLIADYLWDDPFRSLAEPTVEFMVRSSVLRDLNGSLCDAVLGQSGSGALLRKLHRSNLFIVPLDRHHHSYRFHHLVAEALAAELHRRDPTLETELHRRASLWYESQGKADEAIHHATEARDISRAGQLIWATIVPGRSPRAETLERWLDEFSEDEIERHPPLALSMAWLAGRRGDGSRMEKWVTLAERGYYRGRLPGGPATLGSAVSLLRAILGRDGIGRMTRDAAKAYELDVDDGPWRGVALYLQAMGLFLRGEHESAQDMLQECERRCRWLVPSTHAECLAQLALIATEEADRAHAESLAALAMGVVEDFRLRDHPLLAIVHAVSSLMHALRGEQAAATRDLRQAESLARQLNFASWLKAECCIVMARTNLALSQAAAARQMVSEARYLLRVMPDAVALNSWLEAVSVAVKEFPVSSRNGGPSLTTAELRVLRHLPTHLSFPEIGARLSVSRNTVKSQAISVYRKLGVASRAEAVERAGALGLLQISA
jgi:LuxR family transcriptional regulator, maltose regulon positive regulatory protein